MILKPDRTKEYLKIYNRHKFNVERLLNSLIGIRNPVTVYEPINYILASGGKRIRAVLVLLACEAVGGRLRTALDAAAAIEILHNFTLVHDDVMDHADLRRGRKTVHMKWDENVAILSGDEMIAQAYRILLKTSSPDLKRILEVYTDALVQVCEGQGYDKEFETQRNVSLDDYFMMISKKTGRVIAASTEMGAVIGCGTSGQIAALRKYGEYLGRAFQVKDDLLDVVGTKKEFGKSIGGDIREGKKTYLLLKALERAEGKDRTILMSIFPGNIKSGPAVERVKDIYRHTGAIEAARNEIIRSTLLAQRTAGKLPPSRAKSVLVWLSDQLLDRTS